MYRQQLSTLIMIQETALIPHKMLTTSKFHSINKYDLIQKICQTRAYSKRAIKIEISQECLQYETLVELKIFMQENIEKSSVFVTTLKKLANLKS